MNRAVSQIVMAASLASMLACSGIGQGPEPETGPAFNTISDEQLESSMWRLAAGVRAIRAVFATGRPVQLRQRSEVLEHLDEMIAAADELGPEGVDSNHLRITHNLGRFREKLRVARDAVAGNPPSYLLVNNLAGTCLACHQSDMEEPRPGGPGPGFSPL